MKFTKLTIMAMITAIVIVTATVFVKLSAPQTKIEKRTLFPELANQIQNINHISITGYGESTNLSLKDKRWGIDEFDGYPALPNKVKSVLLGVADLKINAPKTTISRLYHRLGVEGPVNEKTTSLLLTLQNSNNETPIKLIVGKPRHSSAAQSLPGLYVRESDDTQSYLVDGVLEISATKTNWIERSLFDIPVDNVQSILINHANGDRYTLFKSKKGQGQFEYENLPSGKQLGPGILINRFGTILHDIQISAAYSINRFPIPEEHIQAKIRTFDGILVSMTAFKVDDIPYARFKLTYDDSQILNENKENQIDDIKQFIKDTKEKMSPWLFEISSFKYDIINKTSAQVLRDGTQKDAL